MRERELLQEFVDIVQAAIDVESEEWAQSDDGWYDIWAHYKTVKSYLDSLTK